MEIRSRSDLDDVGNPMITEVVRNLNIANGDVGETNPFDASGSHGNEGATTINLRGLGCSRTHVLVNGRLHVTTSSIGVDISAVQSIATGRIEILEDGAAALYDSDAIAGVTNFLTRDDFEGIEVRASGQYLEESDGKQQLGAIFCDVWGRRPRRQPRGPHGERRPAGVRVREVEPRPAPGHAHDPLTGDYEGESAIAALQTIDDMPTVTSPTTSRSWGTG